jgi:hypothetical protein
MAWYGIHRFTTGTNQQPTPQPGEWWAGYRRVRATVAERYCHMKKATSMPRRPRETNENSELHKGLVGCAGTFPWVLMA